MIQTHFELQIMYESSTNLDREFIVKSVVYVINAKLIFYTASVSNNLYLSKYCLALKTVLKSPIYYKQDEPNSDN